jgi:hypothetical protein
VGVPAQSIERPACTPLAAPSHPVTQDIDQTRLFGQGDKFGRRNVSPLRIRPADQGFSTDNPAADDINLRLVVDFKLLILNHTA